MTCWSSALLRASPREPLPQVPCLTSTSAVQCLPAAAGAASASVRRAAANRRCFRVLMMVSLSGPETRRSRCCHIGACERSRVRLMSRACSLAVLLSLCGCGGDDGPPAAAVDGGGGAVDAGPVGSTRPDGVALCYSALSSSHPATGALWDAL